MARQKARVPETVRDNVPAGAVVVVPQGAWRALLLGFGAEAVERVIERAKAPPQEVGDAAGG